MSGKQLIKFLATGFLAAFLGFAGSGLGLAQEAVTGTFRGVVTDSSGAIVPNAKVKALQIGTGLVREAQTNELGSYVIPGLPPGEYELTASAPSFSTIERPSVQLMVAQDETVDFKLAVGSTTQTLQVTSEPPALTTTPAAIGTVISQQQVADLPLNGRQFTQLILLTPGASPHPGGQQSTFTVSEGAGGISPAVNGQRGTQNNYTLDGIPNN
ncbi:MAG: carboxypeptidase-like regulatory domain-containing protein, partial [Candidatus Acidiferrum sp.]